MTSAARRARLTAASLAGAAVVPLVLEAYLSGKLAAIGLGSSFVAERTTPGSIVYHGPLGYAPVKNSRIASREEAGGRIIYDTVYSIDGNGFRETPALPASSRAVVFFGDSFTFGEGVHDEEAFPAVFQSASGLKAINLAYRGYGPHQMLRMLELGLEIPETAGYRPFLGFYLAIPSQIGRAAGQTFWDPDGPRYELGPDGSPRYLGPWRDRFTATAIRWLSKSALVRRCWTAIHPLSAANWKEADIERFVAIVAESRRVFQRRYKGDLQVLLWESGPEGPMRELAERLRRHGVSVIGLKKAVPELNRRELYLPYDGHPGAELHRALGLYLARWALEHGGRK